MAGCYSIKNDYTLTYLKRNAPWLVQDPIFTQKEMSRLEATKSASCFMAPKTPLFSVESRPETGPLMRPRSSPSLVTAGSLGLDQHRPMTQAGDRVEASQKSRTAQMIMTKAQMGRSVDCYQLPGWKNTAFVTGHRCLAPQL
eukprot:TRINITY_DN31984_c0_g1_i1.p1 TRINITY_DN31984_c0_g1~~TRINITY_DN31984_c0_g1_i1.p1  ORF type:complete len:157 (+),score=13.78 TRINITY_DN31984_c0_g1_i1:46-471(+)